MATITYRSLGQRSTAWVTLLSVYYSSIGSLLPARAYAEEVEHRTSELTRSDPSSVRETGDSANFGAPRPRLEEIQSDVDARVERFQLAQATDESQIDPDASQMLAAAEAADRSGDHIGATTLWFVIADEYGGRSEAASALRSLTGYSRRMMGGEFPPANVDAFGASLPTYDQCNSLESKYILLAFWMTAAQFAQKRGATGQARELAVKAIDHCWRFMKSYPDSYLQVYAATYILTASELLGYADEEREVGSLEAFCESSAASFARCAAYALLSMHYSAHGDRTRASALRKEMLRDWVAMKGDAIFADATIPYEAKAHYLMYLGLAQRDARDYVSALASFDAVVNSLPYSEHSTEACALYAIRMRRQLVPEIGAESLAAYQSFLARYPESVLAGEAKLDMAALYLEADDYDSAYRVYDAMVRSESIRYAAEAAQSGLDFVIQRELAIANAGEDTKTVFAMACGPMALNHLLARAGIESTVPEIIRMAKTGGDGTSMSNLIAAAGQLGLDLEGVRVSSMDDVSAPFIAFVRGDHYVMVDSYDAESVTVLNSRR